MLKHWLFTFGEKYTEQTSTEMFFLSVQVQSDIDRYK